MKLARFFLAGCAAVAAHQADAMAQVANPGCATPIIVPAPRTDCPPPVGSSSLPSAMPSAPGMPGLPGTPARPSTTAPGAPAAPGAAAPAQPGTTPGSGEAAAQANAAAQTPSAGGATGEAGSGSLASSSPNMYGDAFSSGVLSLRIPVVGTPQYFGVADPNPNNPLAAAYGPATVVSRVLPQEGFRYVDPPVSGQYTRVVPVPGHPGIYNIIPLYPNTGDFPIVGTTTQPGASAATYLLANNLHLPGQYVALPTDILTPSTHTLYNIAPIEYLALNAPSPSGGGVVGRTKISDDNNPLPRDRVIFNYDYFGGVPLGGNADVHRFSPGFEKTFLDQRASVEVRLPFASTLNSTVVADGVTGRDVELGNLNVTLKALLLRSCNLYIAAGLGVAVPTADDTRVRFADGTDLLRINNESVVLTPYFAALYLPTEDIYVQIWYAVGFDTVGNPVHANPRLGFGQTDSRLYDAALSQLDVAVGYWVYRSDNEDSLVQGVAPFVEAHYNTTLGHARLGSPGGVQIADPGNFNELNLTGGVSTWLKNNFLISVGAVVPVLQTPNRTFDYQVGIHANWFFGGTTGGPASRVSNF